jgi:hypothetical protein
VEQRGTCRGTGLLPGMAPPAPGAVGFTGVMSPGAIDVTCHQNQTCARYAFQPIEVPDRCQHSYMLSHLCMLSVANMWGTTCGVAAGCPPGERCWSRRRGTWM